MRRWLQLGTLLRLATGMLLLATFLTPLAESFDRWDRPGLGNDTEMGVFALILAMCFVLVVCKLLAALGRLIGLALFPGVLGGVALERELPLLGALIPATISPPLRT